MSNISPITILVIVLSYFGLLILVSQLTGRKADNNQFFIAGKKSPWILVAIGMIGASLSGVTFISIPGVVGAGAVNQGFSYMQMVFGYLVGYLVIAHVLMPVYYRMNLTSIYVYLEKRFGTFSYKTGAFYFLLSRIIGASFRLYLVAIVLQMFLMTPIGIPFPVTVGITIILIWVYTFRGGIKTIVWTDTLQTISMLTAVILTIIYIGKAMDTSFIGAFELVYKSDYSQLFFFEGGWQDPNNFFKQFLSGALIAIVMTGLDQDMMQKNLSCKTLPEAQKNIYTFSFILVLANVLFLSLGALLYLFAAQEGIPIPDKTDQLYPLIAMNYLPFGIGIVFIIGLIAAAYSSADSALTALTTSFCIDFLNFEKSKRSEKQKKKERIIVHLGFSFILFTVILIFNAINNTAVINGLFKAAGYTYGPILGLFAFGMLSKRNIKDKWVILIAVLAPLLSYVLDTNSKLWFNGFTFGFFILAVNGLLTFLGLLFISVSAKK
jgi:Na+/proline symporter